MFYQMLVRLLLSACGLGLADYLMDRQGRVRGRCIGETHAGDQQARRIEADIRRVLSEP